MCGQSWMSPSHKYSRCVFIYWTFPQYSEQSLCTSQEGICVGGKGLSAPSQIEPGIQRQADERTVTDSRGQPLTAGAEQSTSPGAAARRVGNEHGPSSLPCPSCLVRTDTGAVKLPGLLCSVTGDAKLQENPKRLWLPRNKGKIWYFLSNTWGKVLCFAQALAL